MPSTSTSTYQDDPGHGQRGVDREYGVDDSRPNYNYQSSNSGTSKLSFILGVCVTAILLIGGRALYTAGVQQGQGGNGSSDAALNYPGADSNGDGQKMFPPDKIGIRGSTPSSNDEPAASTNVNAYSEPKQHDEPAAVSTPKPKEPKPAPVPAPETIPEPVPAVQKAPIKSKPAASTNLPKFNPDICEDDPTFVNQALKTCVEFVSRVGRIPLHMSRCHQNTGIIDNEGQELQVRHFCRKSCGMCGDSEWYTREHQAEEEDIKEEVKEDLQKGETQEEIVQIVAEEKEEEVEEEEFAEDLEEIVEEEESVSSPGFICNHFAISIVFITFNISIHPTQGEEVFVDGEDAEEEKEEEVEDVKVWEDYKIEENEEEESVSEGKSQEPHTEQEAPFQGDGGQIEADFFVPLTSLERDTMKVILRKTLLDTKSALLMSTKGNNMAATSADRTLVLNPQQPKQFMHLQHNMTGSESVDLLIQCALDRQKSLGKSKQPLALNTISECDNLGTCMDALAGKLGAVVVDNQFYYPDGDGQPIMNTKFDPADPKLHIPDTIRNACGTADSPVMGYCASLGAVKTFGWEGVDSIAMFANPVERTHRFYQRMAEECYDCQEMAGILKQIKGGTYQSKMAAAGAWPRGTAYNQADTCAVQMIGHQATNLLSNQFLYNVANDASFPKDQEIAEEAVRNLREKVTWVGLYDRMDESIKGFQYVFPWLEDNLGGAAQRLQQEFAVRGEKMGGDTNFRLPANYHDTHSCIFDHKPQDLHQCGTEEVDEEALYWIKQLNMRDLAVYKAAIEKFDIQHEVIAEYHAGQRRD